MRSALPSPLVRHSFARQCLRQQRAVASKRFASSSGSTNDALAAAQKAAAKLWKGTQKLLGPMGEKVGNLLGSYRQPLLYNFAVTRELVKHVYVKEGLQPPSLAAVREAYAYIWSQVTNPGLVGSLIKSGEIGRVGIYGLQAYGIFKIGEIIGRRSIVGYKMN